MVVLAISFPSSEITAQHTTDRQRGLNRPPALYRLMEKTHTGEKRPRMGFFIFGKAHTGSLYVFLPSADIGQVVYCFAAHVLELLGPLEYVVRL